MHTIFLRVLFFKFKFTFRFDFFFQISLKILSNPVPLSIDTCIKYYNDRCIQLTDKNFVIFYAQQNIPCMVKCINWLFICFAIKSFVKEIEVILVMKSG